MCAKKQIKSTFSLFSFTASLAASLLVIPAMAEDVSVNANSASNTSLKTTAGKRVENKQSAPSSQNLNRNKVGDSLIEVEDSRKSADQYKDETAKAFETTSTTDDNARKYRCKVTPESDELVDRVRASTHTRLCRTAGWLDGLFGDEHQYNGSNFRGKISFGLRQDEIEGTDPRLRVRIKTKLPNVSNRFDAFFGRVEEDSYIANTEVNQDRLKNVGLRSTNDDDSEWLFGLGYRQPNGNNNGWDYSVGAKLSSGFSPYARALHRHLFPINEDNFFKTEQAVFWRKKDGFGVSSNAEYTRLIDDNNIWIMHGSVKYTEEEEQLEWFADTRWHHSFSKQRGISSSMYLRGEAENEVSIPEYGITLTYIRPVLRDWLYLETGLDWRWERQTRAQTSYKSAVRFGIQLEMLLGDYYQLGRR